MPRGQYPLRRSRRVQVPPEVKARYHQYWPSEPLYKTPEQFPPVTAAALFGRNAPLFIDIGCGAGAFAIGLAARHPDWCVIGLERAVRQLEIGMVDAAARQIDNVLLLQADALLVMPRIPPATLMGASLHFPVPYHTAGKSRLHLYGERMFSAIHRALIPGGLVSLLTDDAEVAADFQTLIAGAPEWEELPPEAWQIPLDDDTKSHFHRRWEERGRTIWRTELRKR